MKTIVDFIEESYNAGDTLCELITSGNVTPIEWDEHENLIFLKLKEIRVNGDYLCLSLCKSRHNVFDCDFCQFREETSRKVFDFLMSIYDLIRKAELQRKINEAQAELDKLNKLTA